ncbi:MAG: DUF3575 domain-containing protein [Muribaculaceae bacterium]|nr:DUF3575 domain-containing protein [Muribaculaceae bacterium]
MMHTRISSKLIRRLCMLAGACISICFFSQAQEIPNDTTVSGSQQIAKSGKPFYMAAKTNMLYDIATVPDVGVEFYLGSNISVSAHWMYAWWSKEKRHRYWRIYGGDVAARYWFGSAAHDKPLTGHHAGIYFGAFTFDFEWGGTAYMGGRPGESLWNRCMINTGIEYGYSLPIAKHLNIDFTIGIGYIGGIVEKFRPVEDYYLWQSTSRYSWFGPTKAEISLVWLIGRDNINNRKGGMRK